MTRIEITEKVYKAIRETLNVEDLELDLSSRLIEDLEMDSVDGITLIMDLEELYDISIEDEEFANFTTVESIVDYIETLLQNHKTS
ncbi:MAG: acyl carrier protein [Sulfurovum sp.]|nr:MAG: acyl carrier protein [Sulfurovum sp.]RUM72673.1 MAG: acyl carrier protein [Sulfurovum sp.]RUM75397.1 MAG: acyl carrier protein [Sulfurovum sp.]